MQKTSATSSSDAGSADPAPNATDELTATESLIEEISIDGMCGVY
jgi:mycofactocin precursor